MFALYQLLASDEQVAEMRKNYEAGGYGYGHAKQALFELIRDDFQEIREKYEYYSNNLEEVDKALEIGAEKAREVANTVLAKVRKKVGY